MSDISPKSQSFLIQTEVTLRDVIKYFDVFKGKGKIIAMFFLVPIVIYGLLGFIVSRTTLNEYAAECSLLTDQAASSGGASAQNQALAALAGINVPQTGTGGDVMGADIYPMILSNKPFLMELSRVPIYLPDHKKTITLEQYFQKDPEIDVLASFPGILFHPSRYKTLFTSAKGVNIDTMHQYVVDSAKIKMDEQFFANEATIMELKGTDLRMIGILQGRIKFIQSGKRISLSVKMPEAILSAEATRTVLNLMIKYATKFKTGKQLETVRFLEARTAEAEARYKESQLRLASFKDNNYNVIYQSIQSKGQQLDNEFSLAFTVYNGLVNQLDQARIQLKKETPLFTVVEPVYIPSAAVPAGAKTIFSFMSKGLIWGFVLTLLLIVGSIVTRDKKKIRSLFR